MFTITDPSGATVHTTPELECARFTADGYGLGSAITDDCGITLYVVTPESLDPEFDLFND